MLNRRSKIPGFQEGGTNVDPVSGNEVPTGSLPEEVRDDVDAKLSPGEFVIPADVVRFIGLERLMKMRDEAKKGLERMSQIGQMGNAEEVGEESNSTYEDDGFESEIDDILGEIESEKGDVNDQTETMMAAGGFIKSGTDLTKAPKNPVFDVRYYKRDKDGAVMYITHINGKPMTPVPEGFKQVAQEEAQKVGLAADEAKTASKAATTSVADTTNIDGRGTDAGGVKGTGPGGSLQLSDLDMGAKVSSNAVKGAAAVGAFLGIPGMGFAVSKADQIAGYLSGVSGRAAGAANINAMAQELGVDPNTTAGRAAASSALDSLSANLGGPAATSGTGGTGGAAASAGAAAASAAASAGYSQSAIGAAAQAAANAIIGGASPAEAAQAGQQAADAAQQSVGVAAELDAVGAGSSGGGGETQGNAGDFGTGSFGSEGAASPFARGGLIHRRQYPAKKQRGKGIAASK
jgi:Arc/MetJ-type ribon-helix-helix transcriptional regulator